MGAYRTQALSLSPWVYIPFDTYTWTPPGSPLSTSTVGEITTASLGSLGRRPSMVRTESGDTTDSGFTIIDSGGDQLANGTPDFTYVLTISAETGNSNPPVNQGTPYVSSQGFLQVRAAVGQNGQQPWWDLHETANGTIGIATWGIWADQPAMQYNSNPPYNQMTVYGRYDNDLNGETTGSDRLFLFDTGIPVLDLLDGRPHLLAIRTHGADQPFSFTTPTATNTWISISIDGALRYTTTRGPAWVTLFGPTSFGFAGTGADEFGIWRRHLSDAEIASLWGPAVWGDLSSWPHQGSATTSARSATSTPDPILRFLSEAELSHAQSATPDPDPVWVEQETIGSADASAIAGRDSMGTGSWAGQDPWSSSYQRNLADRWLDDQDVALIAVPINGYSTVTGDLGREEGLLTGVSSGRSSVSGELSIAIQLEAMLITGSSSVTATTIGPAVTIDASSAGSSSVTADLSHGQVEPLTGSSAGSSAVTGDLSVQKWMNIGGEEMGDGENALPMGAGGLRRAHFSPKSSGYVNEQPTFQTVGVGGTGGPGS
jgi:hypothetical protein